MDFNQRRRDAWVATKAASLSPGTRLLDAGAGEGRYASLFDHCDYVTQDACAYEGTAEGFVAEQWRYVPIDHVCDITTIPVADSSFDAVLCAEVLEHVPEPIAAIRELARVLRPGGRLFLTAPLGSGLHQRPYHYYGGYTPHFYERFLPEMGLDLAEIQPNGGFFRHYLQESARVSWTLRTCLPRRRHAPLRWGLKTVFEGLFPRVFTWLDDRVFVEEFTVGYFVEARKSLR